MDRLKRMRQRDWALVFGMGCAAVAAGLSFAGHAGAQWDAFVVLLGALMLLRGAVEVPMASRAEGVARALVLILLIFAFSAVNRAQGGVAGAVPGVFGNWILWAVAALLIALPMLRRGLAWGMTGARGVEVLLLMAVLAGLVLWQGEDGLRLRLLVMAAVLAQVVLILPQRAGLGWGVALGVAGTALAVPPGGMVWPVAAVAMPLGAALGLWRAARG